MCEILGFGVSELRALFLSRPHAGGQASSEVLRQRRHWDGASQLLCEHSCIEVAAQPHDNTPISCVLEGTG